MSGQNRNRGNRHEPAPPAVIVVPPPRGVDPALIDAMRADLVDVLGELQLRPDWLDVPQAIEAVAVSLADGQPVLLMAEDLINLGMSLIDGLLAPLDEFSGVLLPGFDGSCMAISLAPIEEAEELDLDALVNAVGHARPDAGAIAGLLADSGLDMFIQPPWYRGCDQSGRICALAHMRALSIFDDDDFLAHRTQVVLRSIVG